MKPTLEQMPIVVLRAFASTLSDKLVTGEVVPCSGDEDCSSHDDAGIECDALRIAMIVVDQSTGDRGAGQSSKADHEC